MAKAKVVMVPAADLVRDYNFHPRNTLDDAHVAHIIHGLEAGCQPGPLVACRRTNRLADGFHRLEAFVRHSGDPAVPVPVEYRDYPDDAAFFEDCFVLNSFHGRKLTSADHVRVVLVARRLGIDDARTARGLRLTVERMSGLVVDRSAVGDGRIVVPLKRSYTHLAGRDLTPREEAANRRSSGMDPLFYANQLIDFLDSGAMPPSRPNLEFGLRRLYDLLGTYLAALPVAEGAAA